MKITTASEIQKNFKAGLQICGEEEGNLQWIGANKQWAKTDWEDKHDEMIEDEVNDLIFNK